MEAQQVGIAARVRAKAEAIQALTAEIVEELQQAQGVAAQQKEAVAATEGVAGLFDAIRKYARSHHLTMLELIAAHLLDDLPFDIIYAIKDHLEEIEPKVKPGEVEYRAFFSSGRSDLSERMEEIIYGPEEPEETNV